MIVFDTKKTISRSVNIDNANIGYCIILTKFFQTKNEKGLTGMSAVCVLQQVSNRCYHSNLAFHYSVIFNLYAVIIYSFCSLSLLYFLYRQKVPKNSAQWPALNRDLRSICLAKLLLLGIVQVNLALLSLTRNFLTVPSYLTLLLQVGNSGQV